MRNHGNVVGHSVTPGKRQLRRLGGRKQIVTTHFEAFVDPNLYAVYVNGTYVPQPDGPTAVQFARAWNGILCRWDGTQWVSAE